MKCGYCFSTIDGVKKFSSSYVLYMVDSENVPIFCNDECMLRWVAIRTETPLDDIKNDFLNYCARDWR